MAEWSNAAVLKTVVPQGTGGSNPSFSAKLKKARQQPGFLFSLVPLKVYFHKETGKTERVSAGGRGFFMSFVGGTIMGSRLKGVIPFTLVFIRKQGK